MFLHFFRCDSQTVPFTRTVHAVFKSWLVTIWNNVSLLIYFHASHKIYRLKVVTSITLASHIAVDVKRVQAIKSAAARRKKERKKEEGKYMMWRVSKYGVPVTQQKEADRWVVLTQSLLSRMDANLAGNITLAEDWIRSRWRVEDNRFWVWWLSMGSEYQWVGSYQVRSL